MALAEKTPWPSELPPEWTIGDRFKKAREHRGVRSAEAMASLLSEHFGTTIKPSTVGAWERMTNQPSKGGIKQLDVIRAYADILNIPESYFLARSRWNAAVVPSLAGQMELSLGVAVPELVTV